MNRAILFAMGLTLVACVVDVPARTAIDGELSLGGSSLCPETVVLVGDEAVDSLATRLYTIARGWPKGSRDMPVVDLYEVAYSAAEAAVLRASSEPADDGALLIALAFWEGSRYAAYVDGGLCNDETWRASLEGRKTMGRWGHCDHGVARSLWQIHPIDDPASPLFVFCNRAKVDGSRVGAARCALEIANLSMDSYGNLAGYTGEDPYGAHPKADQRLAWARKAAAW